MTQVLGLLALRRVEGTAANWR